MEERTLLSKIQVTSASDRAFTPDNVLTLRDAILLVNGDPSVAELSDAQQHLITPDPPGEIDTIAFHIADSGVQTITLTSDLPATTKPVLIDGYTEPGASPNTLSIGTNAVINVKLNLGVFAGLLFNPGSARSSVQGLSIFHGFTAKISINTTDITVSGNF